MKSLFLLRGVPGAGKTTLATFLRNMIGDPATAVSADDFMFGPDGSQPYDVARALEVHQSCQRRVEFAMQVGQECIFLHNTMTMEWELEVYYAMAERHGYRVFSLVVENRHGNKSVHSFPEEGYSRYADRFEIQLKGE